MRLSIAIALASQLFAVTRSTQVGSFLRSGNLKIEDVNNTVNASKDQQREQNRESKAWLSLFRNLDDGDVTFEAVSAIAQESNANFTGERTPVTMVPAGAAYQLLPLATVVAGCMYFISEKLTYMSFDKYKVLEVFAAVLVLYISSPMETFVSNDLINSYHFKFPMTIASMDSFGTLIFAQTMVWSGAWTVEQDIPTNMWFQSVLPVAVFGVLSHMFSTYLFLYLPVSFIQIMKVTILPITLFIGLAMGVEKFKLNVFIAVCVIAIATASLQLEGAGVMGNSGLNMHFAFGLFLNLCVCFTNAAKVVMTQVSVLELNFQDAFFLVLQGNVGHVLGPHFDY